MRKPIILLLFATITLSSCNEITQPKHLADPELIGWICRQCMFSFDEFKDCYFAGLYDNSITIHNFNPNGAVERAIISYMSARVWLGTDELRTEVISDYYNSFKQAYDMPDYRSFLRERYNPMMTKETMIRDSILVCNYEMARKMYRPLLRSFFSAYNRYVYDDVSILNWLYDEDALADAYTGYLVEYEIGHGYYVLLSLTEYKESDRYRMRIIYQGKSLTALHNCYK